MTRNLATSLRRKIRQHPMDRYDRLPPELRQWLSEAALPWSPCSVRRLWQRLASECAGDPQAIRRRMDLAEARMLARDAGEVWGRGYPAMSGGAGESLS